MSYVRKLGASALVIAAAFAVAFAVLVTSTSTQTTEAATVTLTGTSTDAQPGDSVIIPGPAGGSGIVRFEIDTANSTSTGSFTSGGGQKLSCSDSEHTRGCDQDADADMISVKLDIDDDSPDGYIIVKRTVVLPTTGGTNDQVVITVTTQPKPASLTAKAASTTIQAAPVASPAGDGTDPDRTDITATVKNDQSPAAPMAGQRVTFITDLGSMSCPASVGPAAGAGDDITASTNVQWCQVWTGGTVDDAAVGESGSDPGEATVTLLGGNREGTATITITHQTLPSTTVEVTLFGTAKNIAAEAEQGSVEVGGSVFVVLTVTDAANNPVKGVNPGAAATNAIVAPTKTANKVTAAYDVNKDPKVTENAAGDAIVKDKGDIPSCTAAAAEAPAEGPPVVVGRFASTGTDNNGQCVVQVTATADDTTTTGTNEASARGLHTLNFELTTGSDTIKASVQVTVAGGPHSISSDAPENVRALSDTTITVMVRDDEGVLVGETAINVLQITPGGVTEGPATMPDAKTKNGTATFTYAAGLEGRVVFRVKAGSGKSEIRDIITLSIISDTQPEVVPEIVLPDAPDFVRIARAADGTLSVVTTPSSPGAGITIEAEVSRNDGSWMAVPSGAPEVGDYTGRARFVQGDLASRWRYSVNSVTVEPEVVEPDPPTTTPDPPTPTAPSLSGVRLTPTGITQVVFSGGSVAELETALSASCGEGARAWALNADGNWVGYTPGAAPILNAGFLSLFADGLPSPTALVVTGCGN